MRSSDIAQLRMHSQHLWGAPPDTPQEVVHWLGAVQGQDYLVAKWSLAQRTKGITGPAIDRAMADGSILRTHVLRPTWHFVVPGDIRWIQELTGPRVHLQNADYYRKLELDKSCWPRPTHCSRERWRAVINSHVRMSPLSSSARGSLRAVLGSPTY